MTKIIYAASIFLAFTAAAATNPSQTETYLVSSETVDGKVETQRGFWDNGFQGPDSVCYVGQVTQVCALFENAAQEQIGNYSSGEHGYFEIKKCEIDGAKANVTYQRITDYDGTEGLQPTINLAVELCN